MTVPAQDRLAGSSNRGANACCDALPRVRTHPGPIYHVGHSAVYSLRSISAFVSSKSVLAINRFFGGSSSGGCGSSGSMSEWGLGVHFESLRGGWCRLNAPYGNWLLATVS